MKSTLAESPTTTYLGHVKNGVIILDSHVALTEGQIVRVEPLEQEVPTTTADERTEQLQRMKTLFAQWDEEDRSLSDEEAERLQKALQLNRGLAFHTTSVQ